MKNGTFVWLQLVAPRSLVLRRRPSPTPSAPPPSLRRGGAAAPTATARAAPTPAAASTQSTVMRMQNADRNADQHDSLTCLLVLPAPVTALVLSAAPRPVDGVRFVDGVSLGPEAAARADSVVLHRSNYDASVGGDAAAEARLALVRRLSAQLPLIGSLERVLLFADRAALATRLAALAPSPHTRQPRFAIAREGDDAAAVAARSGLEPPLVCKPLLACGAARSHDLAVVLRLEGLAELALPLLLQAYVPHGASLLKACCVGDTTHCELRPSLPDLRLGAPPPAGCPPLVRFNTQRPPPPAELFGAAAAPAASGAAAAASARQPEAAQLAASLARELGVALLGVDLIAPLGGGALLVIDVNYMPATSLKLAGSGRALASLARKTLEEAAGGRGRSAERTTAEQRTRASSEVR